MGNGSIVAVGEGIRVGGKLLVWTIDSDVGVGKKVGVGSNVGIAEGIVADFSAQLDNKAVSKPNHNELEIRWYLINATP